MLVLASIDFSVALSSFTSHWLTLFCCHFFFLFYNKDLSVLFHVNNLMGEGAPPKTRLPLPRLLGTISFVTLSLKSDAASLLPALLLPDLVGFILIAAFSPASSPS